jgi:post-segregation antitoxin (ccd killing protein)
VHNDGLGLPQLPARIPGVGAHQIGDLRPEGQVSLAPLGGVGESPLRLERRRPRLGAAGQSHLGCLHDSVRPPAVVDERQPLADLRQWQVCIVCVMTRVNVYLPDELAAQAKEAGLNLSAVTQEAVRRTLAARSTDSWLSSTLRLTSIGAVTHDRALEALDEIRDEPPTRHG